MHIILKWSCFVFASFIGLSGVNAAVFTYQGSVDFNKGRGFSYTTSKNEKMSYNSAVGAMKAPSELYLLIGRDFIHPGILSDAVLRFTSPGSGSLNITGKVYDLDRSCGGTGSNTGVVVTVKKNTSILSQNTIVNGDATGFTMNLNVSVVAGDKIDFAVSSRGDWSCDSTYIDPKIVFTQGATLPFPTPPPPTPLPPPPVPAPTPGAAWPHQPANFKTLLDCGFENPLCNGKLLDPYNAAGLASSPPSAHTVSVVQDANAPLSRSSVYRSMMRRQDRYGGSQTHFFAPKPIKEVYVGLWWRSNPDFDANVVGQNKLFFIRGGPNQNGVFMWQKPRGSNLSRIFWTTQLNYNLDQCGSTDIDSCYANQTDVKIVPGKWYRIEVYMKASSCATCKDGVVRWWITPKGGKPILAANYTRFAYGPSVAEWVWSETWDGYGNGTGFNTDPSHYLDHLHISAP